MLSRLLSAGRRSIVCSFKHGPGCMWIQLFLRLMAVCLLNIDLVSVGSGILVIFPSFEKKVASVIWLSKGGSFQTM